jgi:DNA uptake protein ComE-like DNA-binding protein
MKKDEFRRLIRDYFNLNQSERRGLAVIATVLAIAIVMHYFSGRIDLKKPADFSEVKKLLEQTPVSPVDSLYSSRLLFTFDPNTVSDDEIELLDLPGTVKRNLKRYIQRGGSFRTKEDFRKLYGMNDSIYEAIAPYLEITVKTVSKVLPPLEAGIPENFYFDPNAVTEDELRRLGFNDSQRKNLLAYRDKGGKFNRKEDILRIFGVDDRLYERVEPWMSISVTEYVNPVKSAVAVVGINTADSLSLIAIPGIGPVFASRILRYRDRLGGFYSVAQLREVYGMTDERMEEIGKYISVDDESIRTIRINFADQKELSMHPYITSGQAKALINARSAEGPFREPGELVTLGVFTEAEFEKAGRYLTVR